MEKENLIKIITSPRTSLSSMEIRSALKFSLKVRLEYLEEYSSTSKETLTNLLKSQMQNETSNIFLDFLQPVLNWSSESQFSWLTEQGKETAYAVLDLVKDILDKNLGDLSLDILLDSIFSDSSLTPWDFRCILAEMVLARRSTFNIDLVVRKCLNILEVGSIPLRRQREDKLTLLTDGIDHRFEIPLPYEDRAKLVDNAADTIRRINNRRLALRILKQIKNDYSSILQGNSLAFADFILENDSCRIESGYHCQEVTAAIEGDTKTSLVSWTDYLVDWDLICTDTDLTVAEVLRILLLSREFNFPTSETRDIFVSFYRAALKTSGRSVIGLSAGMFHVEHGTLAAPSLFYMGRDSALGKGCMIDGVGGAVILSEAFIGGGFIPILIHTHKHNAGGSSVGIKERKSITPAIFLAEKAARFPMSATGLFEVCDFIETQSPYKGIRGVLPSPHKRILV